MSKRRAPFVPASVNTLVITTRWRSFYSSSLTGSRDVHAANGYDERGSWCVTHAGNQFRAIGPVTTNTRTEGDRGLGIWTTPT